MAQPITTSGNVQSLLNEVNAAGSALMGGHADTDQVPDGPARGRLIAAAQDLIAGLQNPVEVVMEATFQTHRNAVVRACTELGIFELVPPTGKASLQELASKTSSDPQLLYRLMRALTSTGIFAEVGEEAYSHTALSLTCASPLKHVMKHIWTDICIPSLKLPEYLQRTAYGTKPDPDGYSTPSQYGFNTKLNAFDWLKTHPEQLTTFNLAMSGIHAVRTMKAIEAYPFATELSSSTEDETLLVDVGGGHGHVVEALRAKFPELKGKMIVQDLKETINEIHDPKGFEPMVHDFFTPQPIKGARIYYFSWILHDWSDAECHKILTNTASAMTPSSRILLSERVLPETGVQALAALLDINMMLIGGMERSGKQWRGLLEPIGLEVVKIWNKGEADIIEARLKS